MKHHAVCMILGILVACVLGVAGCDGSDATGDHTPAVTLTAIAVAPANPNIDVGSVQQFTATGTYSDGTTQDLTGSATWSSSDIGKATISNTGLATGLSAGISTITASLGNISNAAQLTVYASQLLITVGGTRSSYGVYRINPDGTDLTLIHPEPFYFQQFPWSPEPLVDRLPAWSPDKKIVAYVSNNSTTGKNELFSINSDGTGNKQLASDNFYYTGAPIFRDDLKIWYTTDQVDGRCEVFEINYDGSGQRKLTNFYANGKSVDWINLDKGATKVTYMKMESGWSASGEIYIANIDFTGEVQLTSNSEKDFQPRFSPDGSKIVFVRLQNVFTMNADGTNVTQLTNYTSAGDSVFRPAWSPDGTRIAYSYFGAELQTDIWVMNADGSSKVNITNTPDKSELVSQWK